MKNNILILSLLAILSLGCQKNNPLTEKVDPFIGTGGHGHTYPGAALPFGMVQLSPDTRINDWDGCSGYHYSDNHILGFSHTHLSGTGVGDYGDIRLMPIIGELVLEPGTAEDPESGYISHFSHENESASPGYYQVLLDDYQIDVQLTATTRAGFHQYTFPKSEEAHIILDLKESVVTEIIHELNLNIENQHTVSGLRRSGSWARDQYCYFVMEFSKDFKSYGIQINGEQKKELNSAEGKDLKAWFDFDTNNGEKILVKVGISGVNIEGARNNLQSEIPHWNFEQTKKESKAKWNQELSKVQVTGDKSDETIFYTALYHSLLAPNTWSDVDGKYRGHDLNIYEANHTVYTVFSLWDTFRAEHPLLTILHPNLVNEMINSMLLMQEQGGLLPVWELAANETNCMIGYHSIPVIYDAYAKGIKGFDAEKALEAMLKSADGDIFGLNNYKNYGYIKADEEGESVSKTLEYAYDDWCIAMMAKNLNKSDIYERFIQRAQNYKNIYDASTGFMRAKINAQWQKPFDPSEVNFHFTEANSWQYSLFVPQDINGLIKLHGGDEAFEKRLDELFETDMKLSGRHQSDITGLIGQYAHGNEPSHHMAYLYNYVGKPWKSQKILSKIMNELYHDQPDGLSGNEDCGQMSAWYVLSSMGFYLVTPGSNQYILGTPKFKNVNLKLPNNNNLEIVASNFDNKNIYIKNIIRNDEEYSKSFISHEELLEGGKLEFVMGPEPNEKFGNKIEDRPSIQISEFLICPAPIISAENQTFVGETLINMNNISPEAAIYYTTDGTEPSRNSILYEKEFLISKTTTFKMIAFHPQFGYSKIIESIFYKIDDSKSIVFENAYSPLYAAGGDMALIDQIRGFNNFKTGTWQGFYNTDLVATISLKEKKQVQKIGIGFIQDQGSWIFLPQEVTFYISENKKDWVPVGNLKNKISKKESPIIHDFSINIYPKKIKYIKVVAKNAGPCPDWHLGAGGNTWLFADEIWIE